MARMKNGGNSHRIDRRSFIKITGGAVTVGTTGLAGCLEGGSDGNESNYPSQEITFINGGSAGGGFDQYAQATAKYLPNHLPNEVSITNETMGSWTQGNAELYNAQPDGHTIGMSNIPGNLQTQILQDPPWNLTELEWLGRLGRTVYTMGVAADSDFRSWQDLRDLDRPTKFTTTGQGTSMLSTILGATALEFDFEIVTGYAGTPEQVTGVLRGDADAIQIPATTTPMQNAIREGEIRPVLHYSSELPEILQNHDDEVPTVEDVGHPELEGQANLQRSIAAPPDTPDDIVSTLEQAIDDMAHSDEFVSWGEEQGQPVDHTGANETAQAVDDSHSFIRDNRDLIEEYLE